MDGRTNGTNGRTNCPSVGHFKQYSRSSETNITLSSVKFKFYVIVGKIDAENAETKRRMPSTGRVRKWRLWQVNWWSVIFILLNFLILFFISQLFFFIFWNMYFSIEEYIEQLRKLLESSFDVLCQFRVCFHLCNWRLKLWKSLYFFFCSLGSS